MKISQAFTNKRGATVIIALGIAFLLLSFSLGIAQVVKTNNRNLKAFKESAQAQVLAESVMEILIKEASEHEAGYTVEEANCETAIRQIADLEQTAGADIKCSIQGKNDTYGEINGYYTIPGINTGNANTECNTLRPITRVSDLGMYKDILDSNPAKHPCNWGKLNFGNSFTSKVAMPLYYDENGTINNPSDNSMNEIKVYVRTPCKPINQREPCKKDPSSTDPNCKSRYICDDGSRYRINVPVDGKDYPDTDPAVINWQVTGLCDDNECYLMPFRDYEEGERTSKNTEIDASNINKKLKTGYLQLEGDTWGDIPYVDFEYPETPPSFLEFIKDIQKPKLQLSVIASGLKDEDGNNIPYFEYQVLTDVPTANALQVFNVEVSYNSQSYKLVKSIDQKKNLVDFAVQN